MKVKKVDIKLYTLVKLNNKRISLFLRRMCVPIFTLPCLY